MIKKQNRKQKMLGGALILSLLIVMTLMVANPLTTIQPLAQAQTSLVTAKQADKFVDSIGVNTHVHYNDTAYNNFDDIVKPKLIESGIRHTREGAYSYPGINREHWYYQRLRALAENGVKFQMVTTMQTGWSTPTNYDLLDEIYSWTDGSVIAFEGINEPNIQGVDDWANIVRREQAKLWNKVQGDATLRANVKVVGPSPIFGAGYQLGNIESNLDYGNGHPYPGGFCISCGDVYGQNVDTFLPEIKFPSGSKPVMMTETGYHNAVNTLNDHRPASELAAGKYMPRLFFEYFNRGFVRTFSYEFIDERPDPGKTDREQNFGLLRVDGSEKPAFKAIKNIIGLLKDPGASFTPGSLNYTLSGNTNGVHQTLLQKRDGTFYLALWVDKSSYDNGMRANEPNTSLEPARRRDLVVPPQTVTISFGSSIGAATIYSLSDTGNMSSAAATISNNAVNLNVPDKVTIIKLTPGAGGNALPDLVVTDVSSTPAALITGNQVTFKATIKNQGTAATPAGVIHGVAFVVDGVFVAWSDNYVSSLAPGASVTVTANGGPSGSNVWSATVGTHTVSATVDDINRIPNESNELNNSYSEQMTVNENNVFSGVYKLTAKHSNLVMDVPNASQADSIQLKQYSDNGSAAQRFRFELQSDDSYQIKAQNSGKCVDVRASGTANGVPVQQYTCNGGNAQRWIVEPAGNGFYTLKSKTSGKVIDVRRVSTAPNALLHQWTATGGDNQKWLLTRIGD